MICYKKSIKESFEYDMDIHFQGPLKVESPVIYTYCFFHKSQ